jgi:cytochrome b
MTIRIWDLPTRIFHAALALSVFGAIVTVKLGDAWMDWHVRLGIITLALIVFRIIWGLIGPRYVRFSQFVQSPAMVWRYLSTRPVSKQKTAGHNPLGAWSVVAMLLVLGAQASTGLFADDEILTQGPLVQFVSESTSSLLTGLHQWNETLVYIVVGLHLLAILIYTLKGEHLIEPMVTGDVPAHDLCSHTSPARDDLRVRSAALLLAVALGAAAWWLIELAHNTGGSFN